MVVFINKHAVKISTKSSKPSSQKPSDETALGRSGANGKGKAYNSVAAGNTPTVETVPLPPRHTCTRGRSPLVAIQMILSGQLNIQPSK